MRSIVRNIVFGFMFLVGFGILVYPTVSNQWNTYRQSKLITSYEAVVEEMEENDFSDEWELARSFNETIEYNAIYGDAFGTSDIDLKETEYWKILNIAGDGIMGYLSIPKINVKLGIYHGTEEDVLQTGIGHLNGTKLPIGGVSTHCVLAAHRGLPSARLFTDIDQLKKGDMFYVHVLNETFAYQVDQILDMVDKDDVDALEAALAVEEGKDHISLFTCTPYGVNSHRLIVRGVRVEYSGEEDIKVNAPDAVVQSIQNYYMIYLLLGAFATVLIITIMKFVMNHRNRRKNNSQL